MKTSVKIVAGGFAAAILFYGASIFFHAAYIQGKLDGVQENISHVVEVNAQAKKERQEGIKADWVKILTPDGRHYYKSDLAAPTQFVEQMDYVSYEKGIYAFEPASFDIYEIFFIVHNHPDEVQFKLPPAPEEEKEVEGKYGGTFKFL